MKIKLTNKQTPYGRKAEDFIIQNISIKLSLRGWTVNDNIEWKGYNIEINYFYWLKQLYKKFILDRIEKRKKDKLVAYMKKVNEYK